MCHAIPGARRRGIAERFRSSARFAGVGLAALLAWACPVSHRVPLPDAPESGRERVQRALVPPKTRGGVPASFGTLTTGLSSLPFLGGLAEEDDSAAEEIHLVLADGTRVGGLFFDRGRDSGPNPLVVISFGLMQDRWGTEAAKFRSLYLEEADGPDVLILDHPTSGAFFAANGNLSPGSYDDGRMWIQVAQFMREKVEPTLIQAVGVSMSGQTVIHALAEDARLGLGLFDSGLALSIAPDFRRHPGAEFASLASEEAGVENPWLQLTPGGRWTPQQQLRKEALVTLVQKRFLPSYRRAGGPDADWELPRSEVPFFFWQGFEMRLAHLRHQRPTDWNPRYRLDSVESYMATTRAAEALADVRTPLVLLSARDDPAVPHESFVEVVQAAQGNPWVLAYETRHGGHFGFDVTYGKEYVDRVCELLTNPEILETWNGPTPAARE